MFTLSLPKAAEATLKKKFVSCTAGGRNYGQSGGRKKNSVFFFFFFQIVKIILIFFCC